MKQTYYRPKVRSNRNSSWIANFIQQTADFSYFSDPKQPFTSLLTSSSPTGSQSSSSASSTSQHATLAVNSKTYGKPPDVKKDGRYELRQLLGQGSFGQVYRGIDKQTDTSVVLKYQNFTPEVMDEVEIMTRINSHPNVVELLSAHVKNDLVQMVMKSHGEYTMDLHKYWLKLNGQISEEMLCYFTRQIVNGLAYLHENHVAHMDIKPENVVINDRLELQIIDFGLSLNARNRYSDIPYYGFVGTREYSAPELHSNQGFYGRECDMWSLGVMLYILFTLSWPCHDENRQPVYTDGDSYKAFERPCTTELMNFFDGTFQKNFLLRMTSKQAQHHAWLHLPLNIDAAESRYKDVFRC